VRKTIKFRAAPVSHAGVKVKGRTEPMFGANSRTQPRVQREAGGGGKRWVEKWVQLGKDGQEIGKWCSFSHLETAFTRLGPDNSTQVVDFPHLAHVRLFWDGFKNGFSKPNREGII
jgi:hypothetical protein